MTNMRLKWALLVVVLIIAAFYLWPTVRLYGLMDQSKLDPKDPAVANLRAKAMHLGLDLKGGSYLSYEVDLSKIPPEERRGDEVDRAIEITRNRVDQFGVSEPVIQKQGQNRIVVQLPGLQDPQRAQELIGKTARLEFRLVKSQEELYQAFSIVDAAIARRIQAGTFDAENIPQTDQPVEPFGDLSDLAIPDSTAGLADTAAAAADTLMASGDTLAAGDSLMAGDSLAAPPPGAAPDAERPFSSLFVQVPGSTGGYAYCPAENYSAAYRMWQEAAAEGKDKNEPRTLSGGTALLWGDTQFGTETGNPGRYLYALTARPDLTGDHVDDATVQFGIDTSNPTGAGVLLNFDKRGAGIFTRLTGNNVGRLLAIVLDNNVKSAPVIRDKIRGGRASITGLSGDEEAKDLAIVLRAGALPTDLIPQEERTVGPSLGKDSIEEGVRAALLGSLLVVLIIIVYYRASGFLAVFALLLNLFFLFAALSMLRGTLTLPGIAGIVLTIGVAVDANVLIFERVREEIRNGKTVRGAIDAGYGRALVTIVDANLTTLIAAIVLFQFGTGPIKGFATTLMIGVTANIFTAVFVTRLIYDSILAGRQVKKLSI